MNFTILDARFSSKAIITSSNTELTKSQTFAIEMCTHSNEVCDEVFLKGATRYLYPVKVFFRDSAILNRTLIKFGLKRFSLNFYINFNTFQMQFVRKALTKVV